MYRPVLLPSHFTYCTFVTFITSVLKNGVAEEDGNYWMKMMTFIRQEIQDCRSELDALTVKRIQMERKLKQVNHVITVMKSRYYR